MVLNLQNAQKLIFIKKEYYENWTRLLKHSVSEWLTNRMIIRKGMNVQGVLSIIIKWEYHKKLNQTS